MGYDNEKAPKEGDPDYDPWEVAVLDVKTVPWSGKILDLFCTI